MAGVDYIGITERVLTAMRQLLLLVTPLCSENENFFTSKVNSFVKMAISELEQMEDKSKKQLNQMIEYILSTGWLVVQYLSSNAAYDAVARFTRDVRSVFNDGIPEYFQREYSELGSLLATVSEKLEGLQSTCDLLFREVEAACSYHWNDPINYQRLEASRLRASADFKDCDQRLKSAQKIIKSLEEKSSEQLNKLKWEFGFFALCTAGFGLGAVNAFLMGARLVKTIFFSGATLTSVIACLKIREKYNNYDAIYQDVRRKRIRYGQLSSHLESLKETFENDLRRAIELPCMPMFE